MKPLSKRLVTVALSIVCIAQSPTPELRAFEFIGPSWRTNIARFRVNPNFPTDFGGSREIQERALVCGATAWRDQSETLFRFDYEGRTSRSGFQLDDGINAISWQDRDVGEALAATIIDGMGNSISRFDIVFFSTTDGDRNDWSAGVDAPIRTWDILGVAVHEFGHALGLDHTEVLDATMFAGARNRGVTLRTLAPDDQDGAVALYGPRSNADVSVEILSVTPNFGSVVGGNSVLLGGRNFSFTGDTTLRVGGTSLSRTRFNVIDCETIEILNMPATDEEGPADIRITNEIGSFTLTDGYRYGAAAPTLSAIEPSAGPVSGGIRVTLHGSNFESNARVSIGDRTLTDLIVLDPETIIGTIPPATSGGAVDVVLEQNLDVARLPEGFAYQSNVLTIESTSGARGASGLPSRVLATHEDTLVGLSFAFVFDPSELNVDDIIIDGTSAADAEFHAARVDNENGSATFGLVMSLQDTSPNLPPAEGRHVATILSTLSSSGLSIGDTVDLTLQSGAGSPPIEIQFTPPNSPTPILPATLSGSIAVIEGPLFLRGDTNLSGTIDMSDAVGLLDTLFRGGTPLACFDAADTNDDGSNDISDGVAILRFLFAGGAAPLPPFPDPGVDPTPDDLGCATGL